ncbi:hypothetical protein [Amniculibacterium sp. G2-70]|uniref:hypothetical protein n=1 Tax=Amniculibacterium sp. G2-70 TaxID=2767188 RepID=UPI001654A8FA|nr:hypothetical protein [Amniculibacterium sp. G2-70]
MSKEIKMQVTAELAVDVIPSENYEFLMTTREVANGYGVTEYAIRKNKLSLGDELTEGKHFIKGVTIGNTLANAQPHQVFWTKRGVVRLGFTMRSERAKLFRDWAEELIIRLTDQGEDFLQPIPVISSPKKRNHNRLTQDRMISILSDVAKIEDKDLRLSLISKLGVS